MQKFLFRKLPCCCSLLFFLVGEFLVEGFSIGSISSFQLNGALRGHIIRGDDRLLLQATREGNRAKSSPAKFDKAAALVKDLKGTFISQIQASLRDGSFVSLTLNGPAKSKKSTKAGKKQKTRGPFLEDEQLRGVIRQVHFRRILIKKKEYLQVTFKYHGATDIAKNWPLILDEHDRHSMENIRQSLWYILDPYNHPHDQKFVPLSEWGDISTDTDQGLLFGIQKAILTTLSLKVELDVSYQAQKPRLKQTSLDQSKTLESSLVDRHDRVKQVPLDTKAEFLQALGVTNDQGKPKQAMASKLRQCQKFVEIVASLVERVALSKKHHPISVLDLGCGRGYLTFSLHAYLQDKYSKVASMGIDLRPKLVKEINGIAQSLGPAFESLKFQDGSIDSLVHSGTDQTSNETASSSLDVLIALHACDTATDDALWCGIARQADIIVVAPCCHKEVRPQLNAHMSNNRASSDHPLADMLQHNVYRERHSEMVTDSLRALLLELAGYQVQVFEFVGGEHTAKNVMITAVCVDKTEKNERNLSTAKQKELNRRIHELSSLHGISQQRLAQWMGAPFLGEKSALIQNKNGASLGQPRISSRNMPPL